jgi:predicted site-specific integrase-resolvase
MLEAFCAAKGWRHEVITDLGSGLNYRKKGLNRFLELILHKRIRCEIQAAPATGKVQGLQATVRSLAPRSLGL